MFDEPIDIKHQLVVDLQHDIERADKRKKEKVIVVIVLYGAMSICSALFRRSAMEFRIIGTWH
jgi:hypothetical protein